MTPEMAMVEAACFQLRTALTTITDDNYATTLRVAMSVLAANVAAAKETLNPSKVSDIEFALNDFVAVADELPQDAAARVAAPLKMLRDDVAALRRLTALPQDLLESIQKLQAKLKLRKDAIEKQTYREDIGEVTLPHPPEALRPEGDGIRRRLLAAGFSTPALDVLVDQPAEFRFHSINELIDELEVISGT
ncbi:MAG: hypothetical protein ACXV5L_04920 [Thermoanaerobaculia bacterium]